MGFIATLRLGATRAVAAALIVSLPASGLAAPRYEKSARVKWADDAGSVTVAPISVMRWEDAAPQLQPNFAMDSGIAYRDAIPTTQTFDEQLSKMLSLKLGLGLPTTVTTGTETLTENDDGESTTRTQATQTSRGDPAKVPTATVPDPSKLPEPGSAFKADANVPTLERDPMLRYLAATALFQEVRLLNRYVADAVRFRGSQAFLVRLQLSVLPGRRALPYDVTTDITLHAADMQARAGLAQPAWVESERRMRLRTGTADLTSAIDDERLTDGGTVVALRREILTPRRCLHNWDQINVVPLVVTDSLEGLAASRSSDTARQIGLALLGTAAGVGASAEFGRTARELLRTEGNDTNSLLTIGRLTDDTVRVRLGAVQSPRYGSTMLPRTHNISLLVVFRPCDPEAIDAGDDQERILTAVTKASFTDAFNGATLEYRDGGRKLYDLTRRLNTRYNNRFTYEEYARLYQLVSQQDRQGYEAFFANKLDAYTRAHCPKYGSGLSGLLISDRAATRGELQTLFPSDGRSREEYFRTADNMSSNRQAQRCYREEIAYQVASGALWTELLSIRPTGEFAYTNIPIVLRNIAPSLPPSDQTGLISYGDWGGALALYNGHSLAAARDLGATLTLTHIAKGKGAKSATKLRIPASAVEVDSDGRTVRATFPPFKGAAEGGTLRPASLMLTAGRTDDGRRLQGGGCDGATAVGPAPASACYASLKLIPAKAPPAPEREASRR